MQWGQIRLLVTKQFPGVDLDVITSWIQASYEALLDGYPWAALDGEAVLQTAAPEETGAVTVTAGSATVAGVGTAFAAGNVGQKFLVDGVSGWYTVTAVASAVSLTLDRVYEGDTAAGTSYAIVQDTYPLPAEVKSVKQMLLPYSSRALNPAGELEIQRYDPAKLYISTPRAWAPAADTPDYGGGTANWRHVRFWQVPDAVYGIPYTYRIAPAGFSGSNTQDAPLPWVHFEAIVQGAVLRGLSSPVSLERKGASSAIQATAALQEVALKAMRVADCQRRGPIRPQFAGWITSHQSSRVQE
jgi:hypothetical protein